MKENGKLFEIEVRIPNKIFSLNGKPIRSPFKAVVNCSELNRIKSVIKSLGVLNYSVSEVSNKQKSEVNIIDIKDIKRKKEIEDKVILPIKEEKSLEELVSGIKGLISSTGEITLEELSAKSQGFKNKEV